MLQLPELRFISGTVISMANTQVTRALKMAITQVKLFVVEFKSAIITSPYSSHGQNTSVNNFASDNIFSDGTTYQIATVAGSVNTSLNAILNVGMPA